jgi:guanosine-3',5'-bis(diphosphate) 3'-pyrophosphohydrolase
MKSQDDLLLMNTCFKIAQQAHITQSDKAKEPYIFHPLKVRSFIEHPNRSVIKRIIKTLNKEERLLAQYVALLHDVIEDTTISYEDLLDTYKLPKAVCDAVALLSKVDGEEDNVYYERLKHNKLARAVKLSDLLHNSDLSRLKRIKNEDVLRRVRYLKAMLYLWQD